MPTYSYSCVPCDKDSERNVPMADRDEQFCECGHRLTKRITFTGLTWSPTRNGGHS